jgi:hypothetical protein
VSHDDGIKYLHRPPPGWFVLDVMREKARKQDWVALMVDVDPDELEHCTARAWVCVTGKHRNRDDAWDALQDTLETRH